MKTVLKSIFGGLFFLLLVVAPVITGSGKSSAHNLSTITPAISIATAKTVTENKALVIYDAMHLNRYGLSKNAFEYAWKGYQRLLGKKILNRSSVLSICDFSQSSRRKRLFVIDLEQQKVLVNTYVAHGRNSGSEYARSFSNSAESHKSSLGFYITKNTYYGDHGLALKIEGLEKGFNDQANARNIVVHGSQYVGSDYLKNNRFNGRSYGCPAVPAAQTTKVINNIKNGSCLFIYFPTKTYLAKSKILNG
jgi:hypothetical protein